MNNHFNVNVNTSQDVSKVSMVITACLPVLSTVSVICVSSSQGTVFSVMPDTKDLAVMWVCECFPKY